LGFGSGGGGEGSATIKLNSENFDKFIYQNPEVIVVGSLCRGARALQAARPQVEQCRQGPVRLGTILAFVDSTVEMSLMSEYGMQGFLTIKIFPGGAKSSSCDTLEYQRGRTKEQIVSYVLAEVDTSGAPKEILELVSLAVLEETGSSRKVLCVFVALPHIHDMGAKGLNKYSDIITTTSKVVWGMPFEFLWFKGGGEHTGQAGERTQIDVRLSSRGVIFQ